MTYEKHEQPQGLNDGRAGAGHKPQMQQPPETPIRQMHEPSMQQLSEPREQAQPQAPEERKDGSMSIIAHLEELRKRLIYSIAAVAVGSGVAYFYIDEIMRCLTAPAGKLYYMQPAEAFFTYLKIAVFGGFLLALPVIFYEIWRFILPALTVRERKALLLIVPLSVVLFVVGIAFSFTLVLPAAIRFFNEKYPVDLLIVGRGGGSAEDLWAFNEEPVVRAIYDSVIPVISAVGHETDTTLADYVSDVRAATPSQAAEIAVPEAAVQSRRIAEYEARLHKAVQSRLAYERERTARLSAAFLKRQPQALLAARRQRLDAASEALFQGMRRIFLEKRHAFRVAAEKLEMLSPLHVIGRGYSIVEKSGRTVRSMKELTVGDEVLVRLSDGGFDAVVRHVQEGGL